MNSWKEHLSQLFGGLFEPTAEHCDLDSHRRQLTAAALMIEVAAIDNHFDQSELGELSKILRHTFDLSEEEVTQLIELAHRERDESSSLYRFTRLVNDQFDIAEKFQLVTAMWRIAYADGELDKYEEYIIRRVSDLIHLAHADFIRAKHQARSIQDKLQ